MGVWRSGDGESDDQEVNTIRFESGDEGGVVGIVGSDEVETGREGGVVGGPGQGCDREGVGCEEGGGECCAETTRCLWESKY